MRYVNGRYRKTDGLTVKWVVFFLLIVSFALIPGKPAQAEDAQGKTPDAPDSLDGLITEALRNNPEIRALRDKVGAYEERPSQAESLDNPRLGFSILNLPTNSFSFDQEAMTQKQLSVVQRFPFPGKLGLRGDIARQELQIVRQELQEKTNRIIQQVKTAYENLLFTDKSIAVTKDNRDLIRQFVGIAETKYAVGTGIQQDVLKAQVELSKMNDLLLSLDQKRLSLVARLNTLLYRPDWSPFEDLGNGYALRKTPLTVPSEELRKLALENRPSILQAKHDIEKSELAERFAEKSYYPDFDVGLSYGQRDDSPVERPDFVSGTVTITIPLWYRSKESRKVAEEKANLRRATEQYNAAKNEVFFQIADITSEIEKLSRQIELFETGIIPQSKASLESALAAYKVNKVDFKTLVDNETTLYNYQIAYYRAITDHENKLAELDAVVGKRVSGIQNINEKQEGNKDDR